MEDNERKLDCSPESQKKVDRLKDLMYGRVRGTKEDYKQAVDEVMECAAAENSPYLFAWYYTGMLEHVNQVDDLTNVDHYANEGLRYQSEAGLFNLMVRTYIFMGIAAEKRGELQREVTCLLRGLDIAMEHGLNFEATMVATNLGILFFRTAEYERSEYYCKLAEDCEKKSGEWDMSKQAYCSFITNTGNALAALGKLDEAEERRTELNKYIAYVKENNTPTPLFVVYGFFAHLDMKKGDTESMKANLKAAWDEVDTLNPIYLYLDDINLYLNVLEEAGEYEECMRATDHFISKCLTAGIDSSMLMQLVKRKAGLAYKIGDEEAGNKACKEFMTALGRQDEEARNRIRSAESAFKEFKEAEKRQKQMIDRNRQLQEDIEKVQMESRQKSAFISSVSHEIRTPINAILGMDEMILRESGEENIRNYAHMLRNAGKTLLGMINDVLDFSRLDAGRMTITPEEYDLSSVLGECVDMIRYRADKKHLQLNLDVDWETPRRLYGDSMRLKQIIINLLSNAVKYTEQGSVTLRVGYSAADQGVILLRVAVIDTGMGIRKEDMGRLFKPFERVNESSTRSIEGTGLGLSIVTGLLAQMGSDLKVESEFGRGSEFSFELSQEIRDAAPVGHMDVDSMASVIEEDIKSRYTAKNAIILVVDDTEVNLEVTKGLLKRTQVRIETAMSGAESIAMCRKRKYDAVLMDHMMPDMDGVEAFHRLRDEGLIGENVPVVVLSANIESGMEEYYLSEGFSGFIPKPTTGIVLESMLRKILPESLIDVVEDPALEIDEHAAIEACGDREMYISIVSSFVRSASNIADEIRGYLEKGDIRDYTIKVHALKSAARFVGAKGLSAEAAYLEQCGNENNRDAVKDGTDRLLEHLECVAAKLGERF